MKKDTYLHPEFRHAATQGDKLYNDFILKHSSRKQRTVIIGVAKSNNFIQHFYTGFKLKNNFIVGSRNYKKIKGDSVEAWMWFIYTTFGEQAFRRYVTREIKQTLLKFEQGKIEL